MNIIELIVLSFSLSMDSFATSLCKGIEFNNNLYKSSITTSIWFSIFQTIMPVLGYYLGNIISMKLFSVAYYISFFILSFLGISMIREKDDVVQLNDSLGFKIMFLLSVSIIMDAFSVGISYALLNLNIILSSILNFSITFITTYIGCILGSKIGSKYSSISKTIGGIILISLGIKILLTHIL